METGLMVTGPGGTRYWFACPDAASLPAVLDKHRAAGHTAVLDDPATKVEFGTVTDGEFKATTESPP